jgi:outer membrane lipoprotein-sorting protein
MKSRTLILAIVAVLVAAAIVIGVVAIAGADTSSKLPTISAPELLAKMAQAKGQPQAISGEISWRNELFGNLTAAGQTFGMPAQDPLLASGSGRVWMSKDGARIESQGSGGDQVVVTNTKDHSAWVYDYAANTARHIIVTGAPQGSQTPLPSGSPAVLTPSMATALLQRLALLGAVSVDGQTTVAGRDAYVLKFTPAATDTAIGSVQAAVDGVTYTPLRLQVFSKGATQAALQVGFTSVSFAPIDAARFTFTPPAGTKVTTRTIDAAKLHARIAAQKGQLKAQAQKALTGGDLQHVFLQPAQAQKLVPFKLATASDGTRPFRAAFVFKNGVPLTALGAPLIDLSGLGAKAGGASQAGPAVAQVYGTGLGSIVLVQTQTSATSQPQLGQLGSVLGSATIGGHKAAVVTTQLGGVVVWRQGDTTVVAAGLVPAADLKAFARSVR